MFYNIKFILMKIVALIPCLLFASYLQAQIKISGKVMGENRQPLEGVTVRCFFNDSIFVSGTITDKDGVFSLSLEQEKSYRLLLTCIGYADETLFLKDMMKHVQLPVIEMKNSSVAMDNVTVVASQNIHRNNRTLIYPTKEQLRHASNGYNALYNLMIPKLDVDPFSKKVTTIRGEALLCINGRKADVQEIQNLNPKDIIRIDFYDGNHPEYPESSAVVDYILIKKESGGTLSTDNQQHLNRSIGTYGIAGQFFKKKSEFAFSFSDTYQNFRNDKTKNTYHTFIYDDYSLNSWEIGLPSEVKDNRLNAYLNCIYQNNKSVFYVSLRFSRNKPLKNMHTSLEYDRLGYSSLYSIDNSEMKGLNPGGKISYQRKMKNDQKLSLFILFNYGKNRYEREYNAWDKGSPYMNIYTYAKEKFYYINPELNYIKTFSNKGTLSITLQYIQQNTRTFYTGDSQTKDILFSGESAFYLTYSQAWKKLYLSLRWGNKVIFTDNKVKSPVLAHAFCPQIFLNYQINSRQSIQYASIMESVPANMEWQGTVEQKIDFMQVKRGNPDLKPVKVMNNLVNYNVNLSFGSIMASFNHYVIFSNLAFNVFREKDMFVHTYYSGGTSNEFEPRLTLKWNVVPGLLTFKVYGGWKKSYVNSWKYMETDNWTYGGNVLFTHKGWMASVDVKSPRYQEINTLSIIKRDLSYGLNIGYTYDNLSLTFSTINPFSYKTYKLQFDSNDYFENTTYYTLGDLEDHIFCLNLSYRFSFGKKHKFHRTEIENVRNSAIMKATQR